MTVFVIIIICNLAKVLISFSTWEALQSFSSTNSNSRSEVLRPFVFITPLLFLFLLPSLFNILLIFKMLENGSFKFQGPGIKFLDPGVFHWLVLDIDVGDCWPTTLETMLIGFTSRRVWPKRGFGLGVDSFFNYFFKTIKLPVVLFYIGSY